MVGGAEACEHLFGFRIGIAPAATANRVAGIDQRGQWRLSCRIGQMDLKAFISGLDLGPFADTVLRIIIVVGYGIS